MMGEIARHPNELYPLMKLLVIAKRAEKETPSQPHLRFCYLMLRKISRSFSLVIQQLPRQLRDAVCVFYLVLRALDTVEDDTSIVTQVKVPILIAFHRHIYDHEWHFSCGINAYKDLMDQFHHVSSAFLGLGKNYQEVIEDITMTMGEGMAKFINKEIETIDDYEEYCHYVAGLAGLGLSKLFHASGKEDLAPDSLPNAVGLFLQKTNIIRDYLEDINEVPKCRMYWPRQIWSKYVYKLEDLKLEENSVKAVQCLNDMVTNALSHVEDCLVCLSTLRDPAIFRSCAIPQYLFSQTWVTRKEYLVFGENIRMMECVALVYGEWIRVLVMAIGTLAMCYNNIKVFRGVVKMRRGLSAKVFDETRTMADVYGAFSHFSCILKSKVDNNDPNATNTLKRIEAIMRTCSDSGTLYKRNKPNYIPTLAVVFFVIVAILLPYLSAKRT